LQWEVLPGKAKAAQNNGSSTKNSAVVTGVFIHPVKSLKAISVKQAVLDSKGFIRDRRFMIVTPAPVPLWGSFGPKDATHRFLTQRQCPSLTQVVVNWNEQEETLSFSSHILLNEKVTISTKPDPDSPKYLSTLWSDIVKVQDMGDEVAAFLRAIVEQDSEIADEYKSREVRLVTQCTEDGRVTDDKYVPGAARTLTGKGPGVSFPDGYPM
jgi:uncharacterized protein YcbX